MVILLWIAIYFPAMREVHMLYQKLAVLEVHHFTAVLLILGFWEFAVFIGARSCFGDLDCYSNFNADG
jgi:hypothetical protein